VRVTTVEAMAGWAAELKWPDVPEDVLALCRDQRRSVFAAVAASSGDAAARRVVAGVADWAAEGPLPLPGAGTGAVTDAIYAMSAMSMALDFDDYVCFGHTGHSAVLVPVLLAADTGASGPDQLLAQLVANEVEARLGGACLLGPQNGQLWSFIHTAGAALAAGRLLELDASRMAHALAIALYQPPRASVPGFMAPDSKLLTAAEPTLAGLRAAYLAAAGVTGPLDALDAPDGFLSAFADAPLPGMLGGLGRAWATRTMCVKAYPGCAYLDTTVDALLQLGPLAAGEVENVVVEASMLTVEMNRMSGRYAGLGGDLPTPVTINFSVPWNVAAVVAAGELTPRQVNADWLAAHGAELRDLAGRVELRHDWALTRRTTEAFSGVVPLGRVVRDAGLGRLGATARRLRGGRPRSSAGGGGRGGASEFRGMRDLFWPLPDFGAFRGDRSFWEPAAAEGFAMTFPARVTVVGRDGRQRTATCATPRGGAGHPSEGPGPVSRTKLATWGPCLWGEDGTDTLAAAIDADDDRLWRCLDQRRTE
jgi:2-methylcitrate dehydratase PrpD